MNRFVGLLFILVGFFVTSSALAQSVGGSGGGGGGLRSANAFRSGRLCEEGTKRLFYERSDMTGNDIAVYRVCQNGSYYDRSDYVYNPQTRCTEGRQQILTERDQRTDKTVYTSVVCRNNKWITRSKWN